MKKLLIVLIGALTIGAAVPAFAGPDWQLIEQGRKAKLAQMQKTAHAPKADTTINPQLADKDARTDGTTNMRAQQCMDMKDMKGMGMMGTEHPGMPDTAAAKLYRGH